MKLSPRTLVLLLLVVASAIGIPVTVSSDGGGGSTLTVTLPPVRPTTLSIPREPQKVEVPAAALESAKQSELAHHDGARDETPPGLTPAQAEANRRAQERLAETDQLPIVTPLAASEQRGCITRLVRNRSSRRGVRPRILVAHYTVSRNTAGWGDVNAIVSLFDRSSFQASSNYVIDHEGNCAYIVPEPDKAWTQAAANPYAISIEMIAMGSPSIDGSWGGAAGLAKAGLVFRDAARRWGIPVQHGAVNSACVPTRAGIVEHRDLGGCGGGHNDISPYPLSQLISAVGNAGDVTPAASAHAIELCQELKRIRAYIHDHPKGGWHGHPKRWERAKAIKRALDKPRQVSGFPGTWRYDCRSDGTCTRVAVSS